MAQAAEEVGVEASGSRKRTRHLRVPVTPEEAVAIEKQAEVTGLSIAAYLRLVGLGYQPRSMVDLREAREIVRVNGDLGRLGGLLKLWLSDDGRLGQFEAEKMRRIIQGVLAKIEANQEELRTIVKAVLHARRR